MNTQPATSLCTRAHAIPGRIRFKSSRPIAQDHTHRIEARLRSLDHVASVDARSRTASIIVVYDPEQLSEAELQWRVEALLQSLHSAAWQDERNGAPEPAASRESKRLLTLGLTALGLSSVLVYSAWSRLIRRRPLPQNFFSLTGLVTLTASVPLFHRAWKEWKAGRRMGLFPFLGLSTLIALMVGASSTAMNIVWTLSLGMFLEELAMEKARRDVRKMVETAPETAQVLVKGIAVERRIVDIAIGETVVVHSGWIIPVDGLVIGGQALVDESKITGHQYPCLRSKGDWVFGGTRVQEGSVQVKVRKSGRQTYLNKVLDLVEEALDSRSEVERKADMLAGRMVRIGTVSTLGTFIVTRNVASTVSVLLVMSCPCATILAASTALTASIASAAGKNILIKSGAALEAMDAVDSICFDKTGTLTQQLPEIVEIRPRSPWISEERILELISGAEVASQHPIARSLVQAARHKQLQPAEMSQAEVILGRGVRSIFQEEEIMVGSGPFLQDSDIDLSYFTNAAAGHIDRGRTPVYLAKGGKVQGMVVLETVPHPETGEVLGQLRDSGISRISLVSGDEQLAVQAICTSLRFDDCLGGLRPEQKNEYIWQLQDQGYHVGMIGDGVNDALALSHADLGMAIGAGGSDAALEAADIVLMGTDLRDIAALRRLSRSTMRVIDQNFWIGAGSDYAGLGMAFMGVLTPFLGGLIHVGHTLAILVNSSRLLGWGRGAPPHG